MHPVSNNRIVYFFRFFFGFGLSRGVLVSSMVFVCVCVFVD